MLVVKVYILGVRFSLGDFGLMAWFFEYALIRKADVSQVRGNNSLMLSNLL